MRRPVVLLVLALTLAGCGRSANEAFTDSRVPPALGPRYYPPDGWAWGTLREPGAPAIRYGVASPPRAPRAHVILLTGYGESAEVYFETVRDLLDRGCTVWVLEPAGQGGSGRFRGGRDVGRSAGAAVDPQALNHLIRSVVRPSEGEPVVVAAQGSAAATALLAAENGTAIDGLVLWSPALAPQDTSKAESMTRAGLGWVRAEGGKPWSRPDRDLSGRETLPLAWQTANPDLRMGGPAWDLLAARGQALRDATAPARTQLVRPPVLIMDSAPESERLCRALPRCEQVPGSGALPAHLAPDSARAPWLERLETFIDERIGDRVAERDHGS